MAAAFGVATALAFSPEETNLVLAADVPRCPESFLAALLDVAEAIHAPAVVPVSGGRPQPLCAVWRRSALAPLRSRLEAGDYSLVAALDAFHAVLIPEEVTAAMAGGAPENFFNVNTPEEYEALEREAPADGPAGAAAQPPSTVEVVEGNLPEAKLLSFVGLYPVPVRHGMTPGEIARWVNAEHGLGCDLTVVPMRKAGRAPTRREIAETPAWVLPSPNMPTPETALVYPGSMPRRGHEPFGRARHDAAVRARRRAVARRGRGGRRARTRSA